MMTKFIFYLILTLSLSFSYAQCDIKIKGEIKCKGKDCDPPNFEVLAIDSDGNELGSAMEADTTNPPYNFSGCITKPLKDKPYLKFISNSQKNLAVYPRPLTIYHGNIIRLKVKNVEFIRDDYYKNALNHFKSLRYEKAIIELNTFIGFEYLNAFNEAHDYKWSYLFAQSFEALNDYNQAAIVLSNFLIRREKLNQSKKQKIYKYLSRIYFKEKKYSEQARILDDIYNNIGLKKLSNSDLKIYFEERLTNLLMRANFYDNKYQSYPGKFLADALEANGQFEDINISNWNNFYLQWTGSKLGNIEDRELPLLKQIEKAISSID